MFIQRDYNRTENDDYVLNVKQYISNNEEAVPIYFGETIVGYNIQNKFE